MGRQGSLDRDEAGDGEGQRHEQQHAPDAGPERQSDRDTQLQHQRQRRRRQPVSQPDREVGRPRHRGGERDVLGIVEHLPVPVGRDRQHDRREQCDARAAHDAAQLPAADHPDHADKAVDEVPGLIDAERRYQVGERGDRVEQPAIQIEIGKRQSAVIRAACGIPPQDQVAISVLHLLVEGDAVMPEGQKDGGGQSSEQYPGKPIPGSRDDGGCGGNRADQCRTGLDYRHDPHRI